MATALLVIASLLPLPLDILDNARVLAPCLLASVGIMSVGALWYSITSKPRTNLRFRAVWTVVVIGSIAGFIRPYLSLSARPYVDPPPVAVSSIPRGSIVLVVGDGLTNLVKSKNREDSCGWQLETSPTFTSECLNLGLASLPVTRLTPRFGIHPAVYIIDSSEKPKYLQVSLRRVATIIRHSSQAAVVIVRSGRNAWSSQWRAVREVANLEFAPRSVGLFSGFAWKPLVDWQVFVSSTLPAIVQDDSYLRLVLSLPQR